MWERLTLTSPTCLRTLRVSESPGRLLNPSSRLPRLFSLLGILHCSLESLLLWRLHENVRRDSPENVSVQTRIRRTRGRNETWYKRRRLVMVINLMKRAHRTPGWNILLWDPEIRICLTKARQWSLRLLSKHLHDSLYRLSLILFYSQRHSLMSSWRETPQQSRLYFTLLLLHFLTISAIIVRESNIVMNSTHASFNISNQHFAF
jgi:hypothetical protein